MLTRDYTAQQDNQPVLWECHWSGASLCKRNPPRQIYKQRNPWPTTLGTLSQFKGYDKPHIKRKLNSQSRYKE